MDELDASAVRGKVSLLPGYEPDLSSVTFCLAGEDHTLGNALRYMLMKEYVLPMQGRPMIPTLCARDHTVCHGGQQKWNSSFMRASLAPRAERRADSAVPASSSVAIRG